MNIVHWIFGLLLLASFPMLIRELVRSNLIDSWDDTFSCYRKMIVDFGNDSTEYDESEDLFKLSEAYVEQLIESLKMKTKLPNTSRVDLADYLLFVKNRKS